jgi:hypothetical protein
MNRSLLLLALLLLVDASAAPTRTVFRCEDAAGLLRYQDSSCNKHEQSRALQVAAVDPVIVKPARVSVPSARSNSRQTRSSTRISQAANAEISPITNRKKQRRNRKAHLVTQLPQGACPATYEDAGVYVQGKTRWQAPGGGSGKSKTPASAIYAHYRSLPGKTYLKNQGLWPAHCPP